MLQRVRDAVYDVKCRLLLESDDDGVGEDQRPTKKRINLIHRLDRGASGALLFAYADEDYDDYNNNTVDNEGEDRQSSTSLDDKDNDKKSNSITTELINAMAHPNTTKTYIAIGELLFLIYISMYNALVQLIEFNES